MLAEDEETRAERLKKLRNYCQDRRDDWTFSDVEEESHKRSVAKADKWDNMTPNEKY